MTYNVFGGSLNITQLQLYICKVVPKSFDHICATTVVINALCAILVTSYMCRAGQVDALSRPAAGARACVMLKCVLLI